jgi:hypothetical protein
MGIAMMNEIIELRLRIEALERQVTSLIASQQVAEPSKTLHIPTNKEGHGQTQRR